MASNFPLVKPFAMSGKSVYRMSELGADQKQDVIAATEVCDNLILGSVGYRGPR